MPIAQTLIPRRLGNSIDGGRTRYYPYNNKKKPISLYILFSSFAGAAPPHPPRGFAPGPPVGLPPHTLDLPPVDPRGFAPRTPLPGFHPGPLTTPSRSPWGYRPSTFPGISVEERAQTFGGYHKSKALPTSPTYRFWGASRSEEPVLP